MKRLLISSVVITLVTFVHAEFQFRDFLRVKGGQLMAEGKPFSLQREVDAQ